MYKEYKFIKTSTAGNRTGFILGKDAYRNRKWIMKTILNKVNLEAEQYGFLWKEDDVVVINMAGGELCGGAILASPMICSENLVRRKLYTAGRELNSSITDTKRNKMYSRSMIPRQIISAMPKRVAPDLLGKVEGYFVDLDKIAYFVTKESIPKVISEKIFRKLDGYLETKDVPTIGIIEILSECEIRPTIWIKSIETITKERGCTTGTIAAQLSFPKNDGAWLQPSGEIITARIEDDISIESTVEKLSDGILYLNSD